MNLKRSSARRGILLMETLVYIAGLSIVLSLSAVAYNQCVTHVTSVHRAAHQVVQALHRGEQWRADIRSSSGAIQTGPDGLVIPTPSGRVEYHYDGTNILRRAGGDAWKPFLPQVRGSVMEHRWRHDVGVWRWELELNPGRDRAPKLRPLFTFQAVVPAP